MPEIYVSTDVETDGPIPGVYSLLSIGSAAYSAEKELISTFSANLTPLPDATTDPKTMEFWAKFPDAWEASTKDARPPTEVMHDYVAWLKGLGSRPIFVGYPAGFDFMFVYWYLIRFVGESPFGHSAIDMKTYAMALLKSEYRKSTKRNMPSEWFDDLDHNHIAVDDALEQGALFCNMLSVNLNPRSEEDEI